MSNTLYLPVLGLNSLWQVCDVYTVEKAMGMIYSGVATAINLDEGYLLPTKWEDWINLPVGSEDDKLRTLHGPVRVPRVVIAKNYNKLKKRKLKLNNKNLAKMFGYRDAYTDEHVPLKDGSMDHIDPKAKGGRYEWTNAAWTKKKTNNKKGDKTPEEAGLKLKRRISKTPVLLPSDKIMMDHGIKFKEWGMFLKPSE